MFNRRWAGPRRKVEVTRAADKVNNASATVDTVISSSGSKEMPSNGCEFSELAVLVLGVSVTGTLARGRLHYDSLNRGYRSRYRRSKEFIQLSWR